jgi:hypothetical protein
MKSIVLALLFLPIFSTAQNTVTLLIKNATNKRAVHGATVQIKHRSLTADSDSVGIARFSNIANGKLDIEVSCIGYAETEKTIIIPLFDIIGKG